MSEAAPEGGNNGGETPAADEFKPITSQEDLNRVIADRVARERAKFADYKDVKAKAAKLDEFENANRTEAEKALARIKELEAEVSNARRESIRLRIAGEHGITDADDIELFLTGTDEDTLKKQAERLAARSDERKKQGNYAPREGNNPTSSKNSDEREFVRRLFSSAE